jgi:hypothetical protein
LWINHNIIKIDQASFQQHPLMATLWCSCFDPSSNHLLWGLLSDLYLEWLISTFKTYSLADLLVFDLERCLLFWKGSECIDDVSAQL